MLRESMKVLTSALGKSLFDRQVYTRLTFTLGACYVVIIQFLGLLYYLGTQQSPLLLLSPTSPLLILLRSPPATLR